MSTQQEIIQIMQSTPAKGYVAKRFFQITSPQHVESIMERLREDEEFHSFILLPNSKKQPNEALICTDKRLLIWSNEFAEDSEVALNDIAAIRLDHGWFSSTLFLTTLQNGQTKEQKFKCEKEIMIVFEKALAKAKGLI